MCDIGKKVVVGDQVQEPLQYSPEDSSIRMKIAHAAIISGRRQGGTVPQVGAPKPPSKQRDIHAKPVEGTATRNTITLGRVWDEKTNAPGTAENIVAENANAPQVLRVPAGTSVTFVKPTDNETAHGAVSFWEPEYDSGVLLPGRSYVNHFDIKGEFFYNDPPFPQNTGKIIVY